MRFREMALFELPEFGGLGEIVPGLICFGFLAVPAITLVVVIALATAPHH